MISKTLISAIVLLLSPVQIAAHQMLLNDAVWGKPGQVPLSDMDSDGGTIPHVKDWLCHGESKPSYPQSYVTLEPGKSVSLKIGNEPGVKPEKTDRHGGNSGCAIAIDYTGKGTNPDDFIVISIAANCPNKALGNDNVEFKMPDNLPPCEDCACQWHWIPSLNSAAPQQYSNCFSCKVAGSNPGKSIQGKVPYYYGMDNTKNHNGNKKPEYNSNPDYPDGPQKVTIASVGGYTPTNTSSPAGSDNPRPSDGYKPTKPTKPPKDPKPTGSHNKPPGYKPAPGGGSKPGKPSGHSNKPLGGDSTPPSYGETGIDISAPSGGDSTPPFYGSPGSDSMPSTSDSMPPESTPPKKKCKKKQAYNKV